MNHSFNPNYLYYFQTPVFTHKNHHIFDSLREIFPVSLFPSPLQNTMRHLKLASTLFPLVSTLEYILPCPGDRGIALPEVMRVRAYLDFNLLIFISLTSMLSWLLCYTWLTSLFLKVQEFPFASLHKSVFYVHSPSLMQKYKSQCIFLNLPLVPGAITSTQFHHSNLNHYQNSTHH